MQKSSDGMRKNAENCVELAEKTASQPEKNRLKRLSEGWEEVARAQDWLDGKTEVPGPEA
jgi:hypothetical protein